MDSQSTPERLSKGISSTQTVEQNNVHTSNLNLGAKNLLSGGMKDWKLSNMGSNNKDFLVKSVETTPDKSAWDITKNWLARKYKHNKPESPSNDQIVTIKRTPVKYSQKLLKSQSNMMSPQSKLTGAPKMGSTYYTDIKLQFQKDGNITVDAIKPWRRETNFRRNKHPVKEFKAQFDRIVSDLETKETTPIKVSELTGSPGDKFLILSPRRALFSRSPGSEKKPQDSFSFEHDSQQNEGAWVKVGSMSSHVASIRLDFNDDFYASVGEVSSPESRKLQKQLHVAEVLKPLSDSQPEVIEVSVSLENGTEIPLVHVDLIEEETVSAPEMVATTVNETNSNDLEVYFTDESDNIDYSPVDESFEGVNPYQLSLFTKRPSYIAEKVARESPVFTMNRPVVKDSNSAVALILHSGKPHFQMTQRYIMFKEIQMPRMEVNNFRFPPIVIESKTLPIQTSAMIPFTHRSTSFTMRSTGHSLVATHGNKISRSDFPQLAFPKVDFAEHTTLVVILFSTTIFMGYLSLLLARRLMSAIALWRKRKAGSYISRLEVRAVDCMVRGNYIKAVCLLDKGVKYISSRAGDTQLADCAGFRHLLGKALMSAGKFTAAEETFRAVLCYYEGLCTEDLYLARILEDLGMTLQSLHGRQDEAYQLLTKALKIYESEMMLAVIALGDGIDTFSGVSYHAQVYSARLMGDAMASAEASYVPEVSHITVSSQDLFLSDLAEFSEGDDGERSECMRAVAELEAMLVPPVSDVAQDIKMPHSSLSIARRIDVARVRYEMGLVLESSEQLEDAFVIIEESLDVFIELAGDCSAEEYVKEKKLINCFIAIIEKKLVAFQCLYGEEETEESLKNECVEKNVAKEVKGEKEVEFLSVMCNNGDNEAVENLQYTPMKGEKGEDFSEKTDAGSPDTVIIF